MRRFILRLIVALYLPMALVPFGYMPTAFADGNGYLMLCPSSNNQTLVLNNLRSSPETLISNGVVLDGGSANSGQHAEHDSHELQGHVAANDASGNSHDTSDNGHDTHDDGSVKCHYAAVNKSQDFFQFSPLVSITQAAVRLSSNAQCAPAVIALRLQKQQPRAPPRLIIPS